MKCSVSSQSFVVGVAFPRCSQFFFSPVQNLVKIFGVVCKFFRSGKFFYRGQIISGISSDLWVLLAFDYLQGAP